MSITPPVGNTSCDKFNFTSEVDIEYSINGGGFLVNTDQRLTRLTYSQSFSFSTEQFWTLTGNMQCSNSYQPQMLTADTVTAILLTSMVYYDDPVITVALQVRDVRYSSNVLPTAVQIQVTCSTHGSVIGSCTANGPTGTCIAKTTVPDNWFTTSANISVQYGIVGNSLDQFRLSEG